MKAVELCANMFVHSFWADHTGNRRPSEVKEALKFFFTDQEIEQAVAIVTGRQSPDQTTGANSAK